MVGLGGRWQLMLDFFVGLRYFNNLPKPFIFPFGFILKYYQSPFSFHAYYFEIRKLLVIWHMETVLECRLLMGRIKLFESKVLAFF